MRMRRHALMTYDIVCVCVCSGSRGCKNINSLVIQYKDKVYKRINFGPYIPQGPTLIVHALARLRPYLYHPCIKTAAK